MSTTYRWRSLYSCINDSAIQSGWKNGVTVLSQVAWQVFTVVNLVQSQECGHMMKVSQLDIIAFSGALRKDYCTQNYEAVYITLDSYYDLDTWWELTCHQTLSNYDVILDHTHILFLSEEKNCCWKDYKTQSSSAPKNPSFLLWLVSLSYVLTESPWGTKGWRFERAMVWFIIKNG